jgi:hypothetical protein
MSPTPRSGEGFILERRKAKKRAVFLESQDRSYLALFARPGLGGNPSAATVAMVIYRNFDTFPLQAPSLLGL